jgi:hypothetical protein
MLAGQMSVFASALANLHTLAIRFDEGTKWVVPFLSLSFHKLPLSQFNKLLTHFGLVVADAFEKVEHAAYLALVLVVKDHKRTQTFVLVEYQLVLFTGAIHKIVCL